MVSIPLWQMKKIEDTLRMENNIHHSSLKETCFDRCVCKSWDWVKKAIQLQPVEHPEPVTDSHALKPTDEDIKMWAETVDIVEQLNIKDEDYLSPFGWAVFAAKAMRDDKIPISPKK